MALHEFNVLTASRALADGQLSAEALVAACIRQITAINPTINAFIQQCPQMAMAQAKASDQRRQAGNPWSPLDGIPFAIKDNLDAAGMPTSNGIAFDGDRHRASAQTDAWAVARLRRAGLVLMGKLNMHEAALGTTSNNPHFGAVRNPLNPAYCPGGSSGGSAAAVASCMVPMTLGTDTMGSVRLPAGYCGVYGFKPSAGAIANAGLAPLLDELDCIGPLARSLDDIAAVVDVLLEDQQTEAPAPGEPSRCTVVRISAFEGAQLTSSVKDWWQRVTEVLDSSDFVPRHIHFMASHGSPEVYEPSRLRRAGLTLIEHQLARSWSTHQVAQVSEAVADLVRYGASLTQAKITKAARYVDSVRAAGAAVFAEADLICSPIAPNAPAFLGDQAPADQADFAALANVLGAPALSLPAGVTANGLPIGLQLIAAPGRDRWLIEAAKSIDHLLVALR